MTALLALTRSEQILIWAFLVAPMILTARSVARRRRLGWLAIATALMVILLVPWTIYNVARSHQVVFLSDQLSWRSGRRKLPPCDLKPHRARRVVASLRARRLVEVTRERVGTQPSGLPVHGLVVWSARALFDRDADRYFADVNERRREQDERAAWRCPTCHQPLPLSGPAGQRRRFVPGGSLREGSSRRTLSA